MLSETDSCKLLVDDYPEIFRKNFDNISTSFYYGDDVARYEDVALIAAVYREYAALFYNNFMYTTISDSYGLYTNSEEAIDILTNAGYTFTNYYPCTRSVSLSEMAEYNNLDLDINGFLSFNKKTSLKHGPYVDLLEGVYEITFEISVPPALKDTLASEDPVCFTTVSTWYEENLVEENTITAEMLNENGIATFTFQHTFDYQQAGVGFGFYSAIKSEDITLRKITYRQIAKYVPENTDNDSSVSD